MILIMIMIFIYLRLREETESRIYSELPEGYEDMLSLGFNIKPCL